MGEGTVGTNWSRTVGLLELWWSIKHSFPSNMLVPIIITFKDQKGRWGSSQDHLQTVPIGGLGTVKLMFNSKPVISVSRRATHLGVDGHDTTPYSKGCTVDGLCLCQNTHSKMFSNTLSHLVTTYLPLNYTKSNCYSGGKVLMICRKCWVSFRRILLHVTGCYFFIIILRS